MNFRQCILLIACSVGWWIFLYISKKASNDREEEWIMIKMNEWMNKCTRLIYELNLKMYDVGKNIRRDIIKDRFNNYYNQLYNLKCHVASDQV